MVVERADVVAEVAMWTCRAARGRRGHRYCQSVPGRWSSELAKWRRRTARCPCGRAPVLVSTEACEATGGA
ncbi:MAG: hypothetical protein JWM82_441 [Myxococcales bacterium]|nr:hypothetical protein [Myxococcales bacterium]